MLQPNTKTDTNQYWGAAAFIGTVATLLVLMHVAEVWHRLDLFGRFEAAALVLCFILFPAGVFLNLKRGRALSTGTVVSMAYLLIIMIVIVFGR